MARSQYHPFTPGSQPLVSCIMPTRNRPAFVQKACDYFHRQEYPRKELVIVDDGKEPVDGLIPHADSIRYLRLNTQTTLGRKRNIACDEARGDIVVHWDDDDWMASWRLRYQVDALLQLSNPVCGVSRMYYYHIDNDVFYEYTAPPTMKGFVLGGSLCYAKSIWRNAPFPSRSIGEDNAFVTHPRVGPVSALPDNRFYLGMIHSGNTSPKRVFGKRWTHVPYQQGCEILGDDFPWYRSLECMAV